MRSVQLAIGVLAAAVLSACATPSGPWQNANPDAKLGADVQRCRAQTGGPPPQLLNDNCGRGTASCAGASAALPQDTASRQTADYESCLAKLGWRR